jgi:8-oxo-dGTP diphosphatase
MNNGRAPNNIKTKKGGSIIFDKDDNVLIIQQKKNGIWSFPKGSLKNGETIYEAVIRETFEESGFDISLIEPIDIYKTKEYDSTFTFLIFKIDKPKEDIHVKLTEDTMAYKWISFDPYPKEFFKKNKVNKITRLYFNKEKSYRNLTNTNRKDIHNIKTRKYHKNNKN